MRAPALLAVLLLAAAPVQVAAADAPQRLPGLWEVNVNAAGEPERSFHLCVGAGGDDVFVHMDAQPAECEPARWQRDGAWLRAESNCRSAAGAVLRSARFAGDFQYNFQGEVSLRPAAGQGANRLLHVDGRRLAPCKALKPGEWELKGSNGRNLNLGQ